LKAQNSLTLKAQNSLTLKAQNSLIPFKAQTYLTSRKAKAQNSLKTLLRTKSGHTSKRCLSTTPPVPSLPTTVATTSVIHPDQLEGQNEKDSSQGIIYKARRLKKKDNNFVADERSGVITASRKPFLDHRDWQALSKGTHVLLTGNVKIALTNQSRSNSVLVHPPFGVDVGEVLFVNVTTQRSSSFLEISFEKKGENPQRLRTDGNPVYEFGQKDFQFLPKENKSISKKHFTLQCLEKLPDLGVRVLITNHSKNGSRVIITRESDAAFIVPNGAHFNICEVGNPIEYYYACHLEELNEEEKTKSSSQELNNDLIVLNGLKNLSINCNFFAHSLETSTNDFRTKEAFRTTTNSEQALRH